LGGISFFRVSSGTDNLIRLVMKWCEKCWSRSWNLRLWSSRSQTLGHGISPSITQSRIFLRRNRWDAFLSDRYEEVGPDHIPEPEEAGIPKPRLLRFGRRAAHLGEQYLVVQPRKLSSWALDAGFIFASPAAT
jgi:hypothetical protein